jgi:hypothetical protein
MHYRKSVHYTVAAALYPVCVPGEAVGADIPRIKVGLITALAVAQPKLVGLALLPVKV